MTFPTHTGTFALYKTHSSLFMASKTLVLHYGLLGARFGANYGQVRADDSSRMVPIRSSIALIHFVYWKQLYQYEIYTVR